MTEDDAYVLTCSTEHREVRDVLGDQNSAISSGQSQELVVGQAAEGGRLLDRDRVVALLPKKHGHSRRIHLVQQQTHRRKRSGGSIWWQASARLAVWP